MESLGNSTARLRVFFFAAAILAGVFAAADSRAQEATLIYDTTTPNVISVTGDGFVIYKATVAGTMTAIIRAITVSVIDDGGPRDGRAPVVRATSFASITVRGLDSCSISDGCAAFGLEGAADAGGRLASLIAMDLRTVTMYAVSGANLNDYVGGNQIDDFLLYHLATVSALAHISIMANAGASLDAVDNSGNMLLHLIATDFNALGMGVLLSAGANVDIRDSSNYTPLHIAAFIGYLAPITTLLSAGAVFNALTNGNETPLDLANFRNQTAARQVLRNAGGRCNSICRSGDTRLDGLVCNASYAGNRAGSNCRAGGRKSLKGISRYGERLHF